MRPAFTYNFNIPIFPVSIHLGQAHDLTFRPFITVSFIVFVVGGGGGGGACCRLAFVEQGFL